jgi:hypothetical protein
MSPGTSRWSSLRWPSTISTVLHRRGTSAGRAFGLPADELRQNHARRAKNPPQTTTSTASYCPMSRAFRSSALTGTICKSPITA